MISPMLAAKAYAASQKQAAGPTGGVGGASDTSFQSLLQNAIKDATQASRTAETQMAAHAQGRTELVNVVTAVASAEASLETVMAVRDQVIQAYQEIMRMPI